MRLQTQVNPNSVVVMTPRHFEDEQYIADQLLQGRVVIVDFRFLDDTNKQRIVSFLEGTLFGIDGKLVMMREDLALLLPEGALYEPAATEDNVQEQPLPETKFITAEEQMDIKKKKQKRAGIF